MAVKKGNFLPKKGNLLHIAGKPKSTTTSYEKVIAGALRQELASSNKTIKTMRRWTGAGESTVKNWVSGLRGPSGVHLVALMQNSDAVFKAVLIMARRREPSASDWIPGARTHLIELLGFLDSTSQQD